jgi:hypothetical protein
MIPPETANVASAPRLPSDRVSCISATGSEEVAFGRGREAVSADDRGNGTGIWGAARLAAPALVALVLAGVALPWILDSGTVHLPAVGVGVGARSGSGPAAVAKIVVTSPSTSAGVQHHSHPPAASTGPVSTPRAATASSSHAGGQAVTSPVVHPAHQPPSGANRSPTPTSPVTKPSSGSRTPTPTTEPAVNTQVPAERSHPGRAFGHQKHVFFGQTARDKSEPPRGLAFRHRNHVPPGQAWENGASHGHCSGGQGQDSHGDNSDEQTHSSHGRHGDASPGHANGSYGADSQGRGHDH